MRYEQILAVVAIVASVDAIPFEARLFSRDAMPTLHLPRMGNLADGAAGVAAPTAAVAVPTGASGGMAGMGGGKMFFGDGAAAPTGGMAGGMGGMGGGGKVQLPAGVAAPTGKAGMGSKGKGGMGGMGGGGAQMAALRLPKGFHLPEGVPMPTGLPEDLLQDRAPVPNPIVNIAAEPTKGSDSGKGKKGGMSGMGGGME